VKTTLFSVLYYATTLLQSVADKYQGGVFIYDSLDSS